MAAVRPGIARNVRFVQWGGQWSRVGSRPTQSALPTAMVARQLPRATVGALGQCTPADAEEARSGTPVTEEPRCGDWAAPAALSVPLER